MTNTIIMATALSEEIMEISMFDNSFCNNLPNELLIQIFRYLHYGDLQQIRLVCKRWYNIMMQLPEFMKKTKIVINRCNMASLLDSLQVHAELSLRLAYNSLELQDLTLSDELQMILKFLGPTIRQLHLFKSPVFDILNECLPNLEELIVTRITKDDETFPLNIDLNKFKNFKSLNISCSCVVASIKKHMIMNLTREVTMKLEKLCVDYRKGFEDLLLNTMKFHSKTLKHLELKLMYLPQLITKWKEVFALFKHMEVLKITGDSVNGFLIQIFDAMPKESPLRHCDLSGGKDMSDDLLKFIIKKWNKTLQNIELLFYNNLTNEAVKELVALRHNLRTLKISRCFNIGKESIAGGVASAENRILKTLVFNFTDILKSTPLHTCEMAKRLPLLTHLSLENCSKSVDDTALSHIFRYQIHLKFLSLADCVLISDKGILGFGSCPAPITNLKGLQSLSLNGCHKITNRSLIEGLKFTELRKLDLGYCNQISAIGIKELVVNCPVIEELDISSCLSIEDSSMLFIVKGLYRLKKLNISNCFSITNKTIDHIIEVCRSLKKLSICDTSTLEVQEIQEKFLEHNLKTQVYNAWS